MNNGAVLGALTLLGENSHRTLGLGVMNFMNLRLTGVSLSICRLNPTCSFTTDFMGSVGVVFLKLKLQTRLWDGKRSAVSFLPSLWSLLALEQAVLVGNTMCRAFGSVQQDTCPFHLFLTVFFSWVFILCVLGLFLTSSWLSAVPLHSHFFLLPCLKEGIPLWLYSPKSAELLCFPGMDLTRSQDSTRTWDSPNCPKESAPTFACGTGMQWKVAPSPTWQAETGSSGVIPSLFWTQASTKLCWFPQPQALAVLGNWLTALLLAETDRSSWFGLLVFLHKAWREQTSSWPSLWVGSDSWEPSLHAQRSSQETRTGSWLELLEESYSN